VGLKRNSKTLKLGLDCAKIGRAWEKGGRDGRTQKVDKTLFSGKCRGCQSEGVEKYSAENTIKSEAMPFGPVGAGQKQGSRSSAGYRPDEKDDRQNRVK